MMTKPKKLTVQCAVCAGGSATRGTALGVAAAAVLKRENLTLSQVRLFP